MVDGDVVLAVVDGGVGSTAEAVGKGKEDAVVVVTEAAAAAAVVADAVGGGGGGVRSSDGDGEEEASTRGIRVIYVAMIHNNSSATEDNEDHRHFRHRRKKRKWKCFVWCRFVLDIMIPFILYDMRVIMWCLWVGGCCRCWYMWWRQSTIVGCLFSTTEILPAV